MLLKTLKSNRIVNYYLVIFLGIVFWIESLISPYKYPYYKGEPANLLYKPLEILFRDSLFIQSLIALIIALFIAFMIQQVNTRYNIVRYRTILPAILFIIISGGLTEMHTIHPVYFAAIFLLFSIHRLFNAFNKSKPYSEAFDSGFLLAAACLFYFNSFIIFPVIFFGIGFLSRDQRWRNYVLLSTGFILPFFFAFSCTYVTDHLMELLKTYEYSVLTINNRIKDNIPLLVFLVFLIILIIAGSIKIMSHFDIKKISTKKFFTIFLLLFLSSLAGIILIPSSSQEMLILSAIPVTFLLSDYFFFLQKRFWGEFLFTSLLVIVIVLQIIAFTR
jgi:hypothetical protein